MGHLRLTTGYLRVTLGHLGVTLGHLRVTIGIFFLFFLFLVLSQLKENINILFFL